MSIFHHSSICKALSLFITFIFTVSVTAQEKEMYQRISDKSFDAATLLWYRQPAAKWEDALPVGNGRLGAMVFGRSKEEQIQLNEDTYWSGGPYSTVVKDGYKSLRQIQTLVFNDELLKAQNLFGRTMMGYPVEQQKYQSLGNLHLFFKNQQDTSGYRRWLDLETGITSVQYVAGGITYRRDVFSSAADQVIVVRLTASKPGSLSFTTNLRGVRNQAHSNYATDYFKMDGYGNDGLILTGKSADYLGVAGKLKYEARVKAVNEGGTIKTDDINLVIENADAVTLYFAAATNFVNYKDVSADEHARVDNYFKNISNRSYASIREAHIKDHQYFFKRVSLQLPVKENAFIPTDLRKEKCTTTPDPQLAALAYQFGRYILMGSSRAGTQASNLQGIWNDNANPMWDSKYTTNINTQMNYWMVESANLSELAEPLVHLVKDLTDQGAQVAKENYNSGGWVFHQNTDLWRVAAPMDGSTWGTFTTGGAWLCTHLWEHYLYTKDEKFLTEVYPVIKGSVQFFIDFLVQDPKGRGLVTNPSTSPENFPASPGNGRYFDEVTGSFIPGTSICAGSAIDMQIITDLFTYYTKAAALLNKDKEFAATVAATIKKLAPPQIGKDGMLQEWLEDWGQTENPHRHLSNLYGLYPGNVFSLTKTPAFAEACKKVLLQRGDESSSWSRAWKTTLWARLNDGDHANKILNGYFKETTNPQLFANKGFPIQVDGTLGVAAGISEMIVQSHEGLIKLLPALPGDWDNGTFKGVCARGAFELDLKWNNHSITEATILSKKGELCSIQVPGNISITNKGKKIKYKKIPGGVIEFTTAEGGVYVLKTI